MGELPQRKDNRSALPLVAPFVVIYLALFVYPSLQMVMMSFTNSSLTKAGEWVGLANYTKLFGDRQFGIAVLNTLWFVVLTVIPGTLIGLGLALVVNRLKGVWQAIALAAFFLPYILPVSTVTSIAWWLTDTDTGPLGGLVRRPNGMLMPLWRNTSLFFPAVAVLTIWWTVGFSVLVFLAGLRSVPREVYEAAELDGATRWQAFTRVTWPLIWPVTALVLTIQLILQIKVFDQVYLMVGGDGGRTDLSMVLVQYIYTAAFERNQAGYASSIALALFVIVAVVAVLQVQALRFRSSK
jgi:multiple sugar transport system permease protein